MTALRMVGTARSAPGPSVVRDRPWLVADALVAARLTGHPVLPVRDPALLRGARAVAFALGLLALPDAGPGSLAAVELALDAEQLADRLALPAAAIEEAFRALWVAEVLEHAPTPGMARFVEAVVPATPLAHALRWGLVTERLLDRRGEGSLAAVLLFRLVLDRLPHPQAPVTLPASLVQEQLGLSEDQGRRGFRALVQRGLLVEQTQAGRAKHLLLAPEVLVGEAAPAVAPPGAAPGLAVVPGTTPTAAVAAPPAAHSTTAAAATAAPAVAPAATPAAAVPLAGGPILEYGGQRLELPAQAQLSLAVPGTRVAGLAVDPATGRLVVTLEPAG